MKRRTVLATGVTVAVAGCLSTAPGDEEIASETVYDQSTFTFEAEPGDEVIVELEVEEGVFGFVDVYSDEGGELLYEETETELEASAEIVDNDVHYLSVGGDGRVRVDAGLAT